jgi:hypothetical protein
MTNSQVRAFSWLLPVCFGLVACAIFIFMAVCQTDTALFLYLFVVGPFLALSTLLLLSLIAVGKFRQNRRETSVALCVVWVIAASSFALHLYHPLAVRTPARWLLWSHNYKDAVLAQQASTNGDFKHVEWDGWGWAGMDTTVYLVFDPTDSLLSAVSVRRPGRFKGLPCEVDEVDRLESQWYTVRFYTDRNWDHCDQPGQ